MRRDELLTKAKPILFTTEMVQAILYGNKTQTRRVVKPQPIELIKRCESCDPINGCNSVDIDNVEKTILLRDSARCLRHYYKGDILYVRETWQFWQDEDSNSYSVLFADGRLNDCIFKDLERKEKWKKYQNKRGWQSPHFMPKEAARLFLKVTGVRVERLQDISDYSCAKEGCIATIKHITINGNMYNGSTTSREAFEKLWNDIYSKRDGGIYSWNNNPWVWVYEFERIEVDS